MLPTRTHVGLLVVNLLVLGLALSALVTRPPVVLVDQRLLDAPLSAPGQWFESQRFSDGAVDRGAYERALAQSAALGARTVEEAPRLAAAQWMHLGPKNIGGRVNEIALDTTRAVAAVGNQSAGSVIYAATASGGVWRSADAGTTWRYAWDPAITQSIGALAIGSDGVIFAGTGEANPGGGSITYGGTGLYRSKDAGGTWERVGLDDAGRFGRIAVDPTNPSRVFAAASGNLFVPGGERGVYRSLDGGDSWELVLAGENDTTGAVDVAIDPQNPNNLLVATWDHVRHATHRVYGGPGSGVYRSTDGGETWDRVALPGNVEPKEVGRIGVGFAPSDPTRAYAIVANKLNGTGVGLWRSNDGGATWTKTRASVASLSQSSYGWWFGKVWVDPADKDRVFVAGLELIESTDAGDTFLPHGSVIAGVVTGAHQVIVHADQHGMVWDPKAPGRVYVANDGGVYRSDANGRVGTWLNGTSQGWTQHYTVDVGEQRSEYVVTGLQDNMCQRNFTTPASAVSEFTWTKYGICGDGLATLINPVDDSWTYACSQYGGCGVQRFGVPDPRRPGLVGAKPPGDRYGWLTPLEFDPNDPSVMYFGSNKVSRSTDNGITWQAISPDLTTNPEQLDPNSGYRIFGTITTIAISKSEPSVLYVGTDDGLLWRTSDLGRTWTQLSDDDDEDDLPSAWVTRLAVDPRDADVVYATFSSFRNGSDAPHIVRSTDGGQTWQNASGDLPDAPVNDVLLVGDDLVVATDVGVFLSRDGGAGWLKVGGNLPAVPVLDLRYHKGTNTLTAATFGHGIQRVTLP